MSAHRYVAIMGSRMLRNRWSPEMCDTPKSCEWKCSRTAIFAENFSIYIYYEFRTRDERGNTRPEPRWESSAGLLLLTSKSCPMISRKSTDSKKPMKCLQCIAIYTKVNVVNSGFIPFLTPAERTRSKGIEHLHQCCVRICMSDNCYIVRQTCRPFANMTTR